MTPSLRAAWYAAYEPLRLRVERLFHDFDEGGEPLVSVYIPTHNRAKLLMDRAIESVRHQTYGNLEIIVAAHGCTDDTVRQVRGLADGRVRLIEVPRTQTYPAHGRESLAGGACRACECSFESVSRRLD